jgi:uncharacterized damage-inducible protein DinB
VQEQRAVPTHRRTKLSQSGQAAKQRELATGRSETTLEPAQLGRAAQRIFAANDRINQILIEQLDPAAWRATPPGDVRTIAAIFTHMHNVRTKWIRLSAPHLKVPPLLNRAHCTPRQARLALAESAGRCSEMLAQALGGDLRPSALGGRPNAAVQRQADEALQRPDAGGRLRPAVGGPPRVGEAGPESPPRVDRIPIFRPDGWTQPWPAGPEMLSFMVMHEAHHRGQVCMLAHQLGFALPPKIISRMWNWQNLWRDS